MAQPIIQASFNTGEWSPALNARVDLQKYHSAAVLLENFFVDYRGGASSRPGTKYILQAKESASAVRLIPFQASFAVGYMLEFGDNYIRFYNSGAPILEAADTITAVTNDDPTLVTVANILSVDDWVYITGVNGMTQLNNRYFKVRSRSATTIQLKDLNGVDINSTGYGVYTSGGTVQRVYTLPSPYAAADLALLKFAQNVNTLVICHPDYEPYVLTLISAANWSIIPIPFGSTITTPTGVSVSTTLAAGQANYSYIVTASDANGQESAPSTRGELLSKQDIRAVAGTNKVQWNPVAGASSYNVYRADVSYTGPVPTGAPHGFIGNTTGAVFDDSNIVPDYSQTPPIPKNPFANGSSVISTAVTTQGNYATTPTVTFSSPPGTGITATGVCTMEARTIAINNPGVLYNVGDVLTFFGGITITIDTVDGGGSILTLSITTRGAITGTVFTNPEAPLSQTGTGVGAIFDFTWRVKSIFLTGGGAGYLAAPSITFSSGAATADATIGASTTVNPSVPTYFQQRLYLAGANNGPQVFYASQPGSYYNYDIRNPIQDDDAIIGSLVSGQLNTIKSMISQPSGLLLLTDKASFLLTGGSQGSAVTPISAVANAQSFNGASDVPPIVANFDILYVQAKGSIVRDSSYNFYANVFTGTDISVLSSHLFYGYTVTEWAWAEEPFKVVWAVRDDGAILNLTFLKEQEFTGWTHGVTQGLFKSVGTVTEATSDAGSVDAVYTVVERSVNGNTVKYIERVAERIFPNGAADAWCVDSGLQYVGAPATSFTGAEHLAGKTVTGLADGVIIPPFVMPTNGFFTLATPASKVTVGLAFTPKLQTLALDLGEPTVQGKRKKITAVTLRCQETLGLSIGKTFDTLVPMKDLILGNVGSMTNEVVTGLVTGDARTVIDPTWDVPGQYCVEQPYPLPASILGVIPEIVVGDTK